MNEANIEYNVKTFNKNQTTDECNEMASCNKVNRIIEALMYYVKLNIINNTNNANTFEHFINDVYDEILNDYVHLNNTHGHQLESINETLNECNIHECEYTSRHHTTNTNTTFNNIHFFIQIMDSLHFY
eukprot:382002_1